MKRSMITFGLILVSLIVSVPQASTQSTDAFAKNSIHGTLSFVGLGAGAGLSYERIFWHQPNRVFLNSISGRVAGGTWDVWNTKGKVALIGLSGLTGKKKHRLETMIGITGVKNDELDLNAIEIVAAAAVGYRFQKVEGGFLFRIGLGVPEGIYLGFGYAF